MKYTKIELYKLINDISDKHQRLRDEIMKLSEELDTVGNSINEKIETLSELEKEYIDRVSDFDNMK